MKQVCNDILGLLEKRQGLTKTGIGVELSGSWGSSYVRMTINEMIHQGFIQADKTGKHGHTLTISETGLQALQAHEVEA